MQNFESYFEVSFEVYERKNRRDDEYAELRNYRENRDFDLALLNPVMNLDFET